MKKFIGKTVAGNYPQVRDSIKKLTKTRIPQMHDSNHPQDDWLFLLVDGTIIAERTSHFTIVAESRQIVETLARIMGILSGNLVIDEINVE